SHEERVRHATAQRQEIDDLPGLGVRAQAVHVPRGQRNGVGLILERRQVEPGVLEPCRLWAELEPSPSRVGAVTSLRLWVAAALGPRDRDEHVREVRPADQIGKRLSDLPDPSRSITVHPTAARLRCGGRWCRRAAPSPRTRKRDRAYTGPEEPDGE